MVKRETHNFFFKGSIPFGFNNGGRAVVARQAHNLNAVGSSPTLRSYFFLL